jgi:hypothetical protein
MTCGIATRSTAAVLSAIEHVDPKLRSSLGAAALTKIADRGQITGEVIHVGWPLTTRFHPRRLTARASSQP